MNVTHYFRLLNKEGLIRIYPIRLVSILVIFIFFTSCTPKKQLELIDKVEVLRDLKFGEDRPQVLLQKFLENLN